jgi:hypothetical protein
MSHPGVLALALTLIAAGPLAAQTGTMKPDTMMKHDSMAMKDGMKAGGMKDEMATPGMIHGAGTMMATGTIHVVGEKMGAQKIHFTSDFKVDPSSSLHAVLSSDMMAGKGSADIGAIKSAGDQLVDVPKNVDVGAFTNLLVYDTKTRMVVASAMLPNKMAKAY